MILTPEQIEHYRERLGIKNNLNRDATAEILASHEELRKRVDTLTAAFKECHTDFVGLIEEALVEDKTLEAIEEMAGDLDLKYCSPAFEAPLRRAFETDADYARRVKG